MWSGNYFTCTSTETFKVIFFCCISTISRFPKNDRIDQFQLLRYLISINDVFIANSFFRQKLLYYPWATIIFNFYFRETEPLNNCWDKLQKRKYLLVCLGVDTGITFNDLIYWFIGIKDVHCNSFSHGLLIIWQQWTVVKR